MEQREWSISKVWLLAICQLKNQTLRELSLPHVYATTITDLNLTCNRNPTLPTDEFHLVLTLRLPPASQAASTAPLITLACNIADVIYKKEKLIPEVAISKAVRSLGLSRPPLPPLTSYSSHRSTEETPFRSSRNPPQVVESRTSSSRIEKERGRSRRETQVGEGEGGQEVE